MGVYSTIANKEADEENNTSASKHHTQDPARETDMTAALNGDCLYLSHLSRSQQAMPSVTSNIHRAVLPVYKKGGGRLAKRAHTRVDPCESVIRAYTNGGRWPGHKARSLLLLPSVAGKQT